MERFSKPRQRGDDWTLESVEESCACAKKEKQYGTEGKQESVNDLIEPGHGDISYPDLSFNVGNSGAHAITDSWVNTTCSRRSAYLPRARSTFRASQNKALFF